MKKSHLDEYSLLEFSIYEKEKKFFSLNVLKICFMLVATLLMKIKKEREKYWIAALTYQLRSRTRNTHMIVLSVAEAGAEIMLLMLCSTI
jgi:hypothetical protein